MLKNTERKQADMTFFGGCSRLTPGAAAFYNIPLNLQQII